MPPKNSIAAPNLQLLEASQRHRLDLLPLPVNRVTPGRERETQSGKKQPKRSRGRRAHLLDLPQFRGHGLSSMTRLVLRGTAVAEEGMPPPLVVEPLDVVEHIPLRLGPRAIGAMVDQLGLERLEEALDHRVVPAVAPPAHAGP